MKDYKKYIFDLDFTLLIPDWSREDDYFRRTIRPEEQEAFFVRKQDIINQYSYEFPRYEFKTLSDYFYKHGFHVSEDVIRGWLLHNAQATQDVIVDGVVELLSYLKENDKEIVILTSWFSYTQKARLQRSGLYGYIDKLVAGDDAMKPDLESFALAIGDTDKNDCLMIGDSVIYDKNGADNAGIDCYLVDKDHRIVDLLQLVKENEHQLVKKLK